MTTMLEPMNNLNLNDQVKLDDNKKPSLQHSQPINPAERSQQHPLHQYDLTIMSKFYESCVGKMKEQMPKWQPTEWTQTQPMPQHLSPEQKNEFLRKEKWHFHANLPNCSQNGLELASHFRSTLEGFFFV